jgi:hypothetical protein
VRTGENYGDIFPLLCGCIHGRCQVSRPGREITQIYEDTNQIQRMVMARALLNG